MSEILPAPPPAPGVTGGRILSPAAGASDQPPKRQTPDRRDAKHDATAPPASGHNEPPVTLAATLAPLQEASELSGTIIGRDPGGAPILQSPAGTFSLIAAVSLSVGARIQLHVVSVGATARATILRADGKPLPGPARAQLILTRLAAAPEAPSAPPATGFLPLLVAGRWPALEDAIEVIAFKDAVQAGAVAPALPAANARLGPALLFFLSALRSGDLGGWFGARALATLQAAAADTARRLADDFAALGRQARLAAEPGTDEWRPIVFPLSDGETLRTLTLFVRHHRHRDAGGWAESATRFVVEAELSRLGALQLDGLVRDSRFDLILRSGRRLSGTAEADIRRLFDHALAPGKISGTLVFHAVPDFPVAPLADYLRAHGAIPVDRVTA